MALAALLANGRPAGRLGALAGLERRLISELRRGDSIAALASAQRCAPLVRLLSRELRRRGAAGLAVGDSLLRESSLARAALDQRRWDDALAAARATEAALGEARRLH
ncbi:MAG: hypothetical protein ACYDCL_22160 [Myxococcales bacterium]